MMNWQIATITYNVNGQKPTNADVDKWLEHEMDLFESNIICVALQEVSHVEVFSTVLSDNCWTDCLCSFLTRRGFILLHRSCLATNFLLIFCVENVLHLLSDNAAIPRHLNKIDSRWCRQTFGGHKGTISCCLIFKNESIIVFMASHFIHGEKNLHYRVEQYRQSLQCCFSDLTLHSPSSTSTTFWLGDFNFRIDGCRDTPVEIIDKLNRFNDNNDAISDAPTLIDGLIDNFDQLLKCKRRGQVFKDFNEPAIKFLPTYRILVGNRNYDSLRMPSWCDRILYKTNNLDQLDTLRYTSLRNITLSDHYPVLAIFCLKNSSQLPLSPSSFSLSPSTSSKITETTVMQPIQRKWNCIFDKIPTWLSSIPFVCRFHIDNQFWRQFGGYRDWIGIYCTEICAISKPLHWLYLFTCYADEALHTAQESLLLDQPNAGSHTLTTTNKGETENENRHLVAEFPALTTGRYKIGYFNAQLNCLHGLSDEFIVNNFSM